MRFLFLIFFMASALLAVDLRKFDATIVVLASSDCELSEKLAQSLSRVQTHLKIQGKNLTVTECHGDFVKVAPLKNEIKPLKARQQKRQEEFLRRTMRREGLREIPQKGWGL